MASASSSSLPVRKWGPGTAAIARALIAAKAPMTQVALARAVGVSQPRASQVLKQLTDAHAVSAVPRGYRGRPARLLELYRDRARPHLAEPETYWYSTRPLTEQAHRITDIARDARVALAFSADLGPDLLAPWRHPTLTIVYANNVLPLESAGLVPAEGQADASIVWRWTSDTTLLVAPEPWPRVVDDVPLADPVQQWWDLHDLGGEDRLEASDRLRRAIIEKSIAIAA
jgi:DNA-binding transcriptional ArsR family regulator